MASDGFDPKVLRDAYDAIAPEYAAKFGGEALRDAALLNSACWARGVAGRELDVAIGQCRRSLEIRPNAPATLEKVRTEPELATPR